MTVGPKVSALVLTLNEESNIARCLRALAWCDDIVVLDSFSRDGTVERARSCGARVLERVFDDFARQRNWAIDHVTWKYGWILHLDADEVVTSALASEIDQATKTDAFDAYRIPSKMMFGDRWLRYAGMYPAYQVRLGRRDVLRFRQAGHGQREGMDGVRIGTLREPYLHYSFSKGLDDWIERHNRYSMSEASDNVRSLREGPLDWKGFMSFRDPTRRRRSLKELSVRMPFRPLLRFLYMYVMRAGFLDGRAGLTYCRLLTMYEAMIVLKVADLLDVERQSASGISGIRNRPPSGSA